MKTKDIIIGIGIMVLLVLIDQITKIWVVKSFEFQKEVKVIPKIINFKYTKNEGGAFSIFSGNIALFIIITILALLFFGYLMKDFDLINKPFFSISLILIIAGTIGNFIDRISRGSVVDFIEFAFWPRFAIFNFADMCLTVGIIVMMGSLLIGDLVK